mmetsp:Transcript_86761/g.269674  ORF Transcript_86761/g.269674 Transcript_86761/m.269674 type:complete len:416 (+) Transcript_86761:47-1294(+)
MDLVSAVLFPVPPSSYSAESFPGELLSVPRSLNPQTSLPEDFVPLLLLRHLRARFLVIFLHSNFEDIGRCRGFCRAMRDELGVHVIAAEYPGYGICPGERCDERGATESANTAFRFACEVLRWPLQHIIVVGRSVGTGPAVALAVEHRVGGLVLVSPFLSVREACRERLGPVANLIDERFPSRDRMPYVRAPCLIIHGSQDTTIPLRHGEQLYELCQTLKRLVTPNLGHNASLLQCREHFIEPVMEFFRLPQACAHCEELQVPSWALDRRLATRPTVVRFFSSPPPGQRPSCLGCRSWNSPPCGHGGSCSVVACTRVPTRFGGVSLVEDTIAEAVEHILAGGRDGDEYASRSTKFSSGSCTAAPREPSLLLSDEDANTCDDVGPTPPHPTMRPHLARVQVSLPPAVQQFGGMVRV